MAENIEKLRFLTRDLAYEVVAAAGTPTYAYDMATLKKQAESALAFRKWPSSHVLHACYSTAKTPWLTWSLMHGFFDVYQAAACLSVEPVNPAVLPVDETLGGRRIRDESMCIKHLVFAEQRDKFKLICRKLFASASGEPYARLKRCSCRRYEGCDFSCKKNPDALPLQPMLTASLCASP
jgi:hypothetical protein